MDPTIVAALIGVGGTVGGAILTVIVTRLLDSSILSARNVRQFSLTGRWKGSVHQEGGGQIDLQITLALRSTPRTVRGEADLHGIVQNREMLQHLALEGRFIYERFLKMEYETRNQPGIVQFGFCLLELSPDGRELKGHFLGYGATSRTIIWGSLELYKMELHPST